MQAGVVGDGGDDDDGLALMGLGAVLVRGGRDDAGDGDGRAVRLGHIEAAEDGGVEGRVGTAWAESLAGASIGAVAGGRVVRSGGGQGKKADGGGAL